ncbi:acetyl-CoA C-acyltransferase [Thermoplasmatales archaeon SW_10_69_26]|nr:MAG: acetyl-CoA C-acyltransferase [Thermoplasmatales archaeon SW_10_69_26]
MADEVVLAGAVRTPVGKLLGDLAGYSATELGARVVEETVDRTGVDPDAIDEVVVGNAIQAGNGQNPARQAALNGGLPATVSAFTVNKVCGSSLKAAMLADQSIRLDQAQATVIGGIESMTNAPHLMRDARRGQRMGSASLEDSMLHDGLTDPFNEIHMGETGEIVAEENGITREQADEFAERSHERAARAHENGWFKDEIVPIEARRPDGKREGELVTVDETMRPDTTADELSTLSPVFREDGVVTPGNASPISDGASAMVVASREFAEESGLPVQARIEGYGMAGVEPERVMSAPIPGTRQLLADLDLTIDDIDLFEHNEAFATASCAVRANLEVPDDMFNVSGGAIALGHPLGASGARILTTLVHNLQRTGEHRGLATLCLGGGNSVQMVVERTE